MLEKISMEKYLSKWNILFLNIGILILIGIVDYISGVEVVFTLFYLIPIILVAWSLGTIQGFILASIATIIKIETDILMLSTYESLWIPLWNDIIRSCLFFLIAWLLSSLKKSLMKERKLSQMRNELLGMAAHDLINPINGINLYAQYMKEILEKEISNSSISYLDKISKLCNSMSSLINDILDYSNIESSSITLNLESLNYKKTIGEIVDFYNKLSSKKEITISFFCPEKEITLQFDALKIEQVIGNLLSNAIKYSNPKSEIKVEINSVNNMIETSVTDNGMGIPENEIEKIFHPFVKTSTKPTAGEKSTGLGLAIVKKIVEAHNGNISVESKVNEGSIFKFYLPKIT